MNLTLPAVKKDRFNIQKLSIVSAEIVVMIRIIAAHVCLTKDKC